MSHIKLAYVKNTQSTHARKVRFVSPLHTTFSRGGKGWPEVPRCPPTVKVRQVGMVGVVPPNVDHLLDHLKAGVHELDAGLQLLILTGPGGCGCAQEHMWKGMGSESSWSQTKVLRTRAGSDLNSCEAPAREAFCACAVRVTCKQGQGHYVQVNKKQSEHPEGTVINAHRCCPHAMCAGR